MPRIPILGPNTPQRLRYSGIALRLAKSQHLHLPLAAATRKQYDRMVKAGLGELDKSGIAELTFKNRKADVG